MPAAFISNGTDPLPIVFQWWGDELTGRKVRGVCRIGGMIAPELLVHVQDARLIPLQVDFYEVPLQSVVPLPVALAAEEENIHPRLLLRAADLPRLRSTSHPARKESFGRITSLLMRGEHPLRTTPESKIPPGIEGLTDEDRLLLCAYVALLFPAEENRRRARDAYFRYLQKTRSPDFGPLTIDTQSGEVLFLLSVGYDWLHECLSPQEQEAAGKRLREVAGICWNHLGYHRTDYAQAHFLGCGLGLLAFSLLFPRSHPRAAEWIGFFHGVLRYVCTTIPADGFFPHGLNMWIYETGFLLRWLELFRTAAGLDLWQSAGALEESSHFRSAATSPDGLYGITFGDPQFRVGGDSWCHDLIAARTGSRAARWLGDFLRNRSVEGVDYRLAPARRRVYEHLWLDAEIPPERSPERVSIFPDGGQAFVRSERSVFTFRSGSPLGNHRYRSGIPGAYGHSDPCNGSFLLYDAGRLLVSGPGPVYRRDTALQNVITIDSQGQVGDSAVWLPDFFPPEFIPPAPEFRIEGGSLSVAAECAPAYLAHLGVVRMQRRLSFRPGRFIAGIDDVELDTERSIEWNLHSADEFTHAASVFGRQWALQGHRKPGLRVSLFEPASVEWTTGKTEFIPAYPHDGGRDYFLRCAVRGRSARFVWIALLPGEPEFNQWVREEGLLVLGDGSQLTFDGRWIQCRTGREKIT